MSESAEDVREFWEQFYGDTERKWSGRVNTRLVDVTSDLAPARALDLGCGEGADAIWLAERGWQVVAVDVSATALQRARAAAVERKVSSRIAFERHDLPDSFPEGRYDLVSSQFLHSPVRLDRDRTLRLGADAVAVGGTLLIVDHAAAPPWTDERAHEQYFPAPEEVLASLQLDDARWDRLRADSTDREAVGPDGQEATLTDNVIVLRRKG
jgi:chemotaxis protein methyltransferase CheR